MTRRRSRMATLLRLSPLYLLSAIILYVLLLMDKDFDYLAAGKKSYAAREYSQALGYLDKGLDKNKYQGSQLLQLHLTRARALGALRSFNNALKDLDKIIQISPHSAEADDARVMRGDILLAMGEFKDAIDVYETLSLAVDPEEREKAFELKTKAAAAAYNYSSSILADIRGILDRALDDFLVEFEGVERFVTDVHQDYDLAYLSDLLADRIPSTSLQEVQDLALEANRYYRFAFETLWTYPEQGLFNPLSSLFLVEMLYRNGLYREALFECCLALKEPLLEKQRQVIQQTRADIFWEMGSFKEVSKAYWDLFMEEEDPMNRTELLEKSMLARLNGEDFSGLIQECEKMFATGLEDLVLKYCLGTAYLKSGHTYKAIPFLSSIVEAVKNGTFPPHLLNSPVRKDSFLTLADAYMETKAYGQALDTLDSGIRFYPEELEFRKRKIELYEEHLDNPIAPSEDYLYLLEHGPRDPSIYERWIQAEDQRYRTWQGYTLADRAKFLVDRFDRKVVLVSGDPKRFSELTLAAAFPEAEESVPLKLALSQEMIQNRGRREQGKSILRMLVRAHPEILELSYRLGDLYLREGDVEPALVEFKKILKRDPSDVETIAKAVICYRDLGDFMGEGRLIQSMIERGDQELCLWMIGRRIYEQGDLEDFRRLYDYLETIPESIQKPMDLMAACCYLEMNEPDLAKERYLPILEKDPDDLAALKVKVRYLLEYGEFAEDEDAPPVDEEPKTEDEPAVEEEDASPASELDALVDQLRGLGPTMYRNDLEELVDLFMDRDRPDLVIRFLDGIETLFPVKPETNRLLATAYQEEGLLTEAAETILDSAETLDDYRWAYGLALLSPTDPSIPVRIVEDSHRITESGEFFLAAAGYAALKGKGLEIERNLLLASKYKDFGRYDPREAASIDLLTRLLRSSPTEEPGPEDKSASSDGAPGENAASPGTETTPSDSEDPKGRFRDKPNTLRLPIVRVDRAQKKPVPGQGVSVSADGVILLDGIALEKRYGAILPQAKYWIKNWSADRTEDTACKRNLLTHLLLRRIPNLEAECLDRAEEVLAVDPTQGWAARYIIDDDGFEGTLDEKLAILEPALEAVPGDFETLRSMALTRARAGDDNEEVGKLLDEMRAQSTDTARTTLASAEIEHLRGDEDQALTLCSKLLEEYPNDAEVLNNLIPVLSSIKATDGIAQTVSSLLSMSALDEASLDAVTTYLKEDSVFSPAEADLARMLLDGLPPGKRPSLLSILANYYAGEGESVQVVELAEALLDLLQSEGLNAEELGLAFLRVDANLETTGHPEMSLKLLDKIYSIRPDDTKILKRMSDIAYSLDRIRLSAKYLESYNLLCPWDFKACISLIRNWFFETGQYAKAKQLLKQNKKAIYRRDPALVVQIQMGNLFLNGRIENAIAEGLKALVRDEEVAPEILYYLGVFSYFLDGNPSAVSYLSKLNSQFEDHPYRARTDYLLDKMAATKAAARLK